MNTEKEIARIDRLIAHHELAIKRKEVELKREAEYCTKWGWGSSDAVRHLTNNIRNRKHKIDSLLRERSMLNG